jgi:DNA polymerase III subunit delta
MAADLKPIYLIFGDSFQVDEALKRLRDRVGAEGATEIDATSSNAVNNALRAAETLPFFAVTNLIVVRRADKLKAEEARPLAAYAANPNPATVMVLTAEKMAKTTVLYKAIAAAGTVFEYKAPKGADLVNWVVELAKQEGNPMDHNAARRLIALVGTDQQALRQETKKAAVYAGAGQMIDIIAVEAVASANPETSIFTMVDALGLKKADVALAELSKLLFAGEPAQRILYMIARQFRILLKAKAIEQQKGRMTGGDAVKFMGVPPFLMDKYRDQARRYTEANLRTIYRYLVETEVAAKTGKQEPTLALELLIVKISDI